MHLPKMATKNIAQPGELTVACIDRLLARSTSARGLPPSSFIARGAALISVQDASRLNLHVTQEVLLTHDGNVTIASVWPFSRVEPGYVALDAATQRTLHIPRDAPVARMQPSTPTGTPSKTTKKGGGSSKKNSGKKKRNTPNTTPDRRGRFEARLTPPHSGGRRGRFEARDAPSPMQDAPPETPALARVRIQPLAMQVSCAGAVEISLAGAASMLGAEHAAALKQAILGRALRKDMLVPFSVLGVQTLARVSKLRVAGEDGVDVVRVAENTAITFARVTEKDETRTRSSNALKLADLGGIRNAADELLALVKDALASDLSYALSMNGGLAEPSKGALLFGPSGTGKSALARAVAFELQMHVEEVHGAAVYAGAEDGTGSAFAIAQLETAFARTAARAPAVLVLDDIDAFARQRGLRNEPNSAGQDNADDSVTEVESIAHDVVRLIEGATHGVYVIATTSNVDVIDASLRRPGRLDAEIALEIPDAHAREDVLRVVSAKARASGRVSFNASDGDAMARLAYGTVHADIASAWLRATSTALSRDGPDATISASDFERALASTTPSALREVAVEIPRTRWADVGGQDEAKRRLREAVELPLSDRGRAMLMRLRLQPPRGILLYGPPGCSKTLLARAVACESRANFLSVRGPELLSKWVGASERAVRSVFRRARAAAPAVVFFDEIDALASSRDGHAGASAHSRVVAQLLAEMDGVHANDGAHGERVVVIAATNRPDLLDRALLRPGRIDVQIYVGLPDVAEREAILRVHTRKTPLAPDVELERLASPSFSGGMSGAELAALVREAALAAMEEDPENASVVSMQHFERAHELVQRRTTPEMVTFFEQYRNSLRLGAV